MTPASLARPSDGRVTAPGRITVSPGFLTRAKGLDVIGFAILRAPSEIVLPVKNAKKLTVGLKTKSFLFERRSRRRDAAPRARWR